MDVRYSVYRKKDEFPVAINATIPQCAKAMGIKPSSFKEIVSRQRHGKIGTSREWKWEIIREVEDG
jgi:hypothetical protein